MGETKETDTVAAWLDGLGLARYAAVFQEHDIEFGLLGDLTADDLKEMGVISVGHRRTLLSAAALIRRGTPAPLTDPPLVEQRIVTALFCDLVGSTHLSTHLDPEDYRDLIAAFRAEVEHAMARYHGYVNNFLGDGIVAFFGLAGGHDHAAEDAVASSLGILAALRGMPAVKGHKLQVRMGLATGMTVTTSPDGLGNLQDAVVGETPNLAARLQEAADPDSILISQATRDRLGDLFVLKDMGRLALKGMERDQRAFQVLGHAEVGSRFEALRVTSTSAAFVGRRSELALLARQHDKAVQEGQLTVTLISGESGLGKSRLAREAMMAATPEVGRLSVLQCTPYHTATPLLPLRRFLDRKIGRTEANRIETPSVTAFLADFGITDPDAAGLLADFLFETDTQIPGAPQAAHDRRVALLALLAQITHAIGARDGLILIEDVHWLDPTTAELLTSLGESGKGGWHLIATTRPKPLPDWCRATGAEVIALDRLAPKEFAALIRAVAEARLPGHVLTDAETEEIALRCDNSPVFAEELTQFWLERASGAAQGQEPALPASLSDLLLARLDRLVEGRQLLQVASVIGQEFPVPLLQAVSDLTEAEAERGISALIGAGVLQPAQSPFGRSVRFRHMLLQDAAYMTLLRRNRTALHGRIADTMTRRFPDLATALPQVVAHHLSRAARPVEAAAEWQTAGRSAARRSAYAEATTHLRHSIDELAQAAKAGAETDPVELQARISLASALIALHGFGATVVRTEMQRVEDLVARSHQGDQLIPLLVPQWAYLGATGQQEASLVVARRILDLAASGSEVDILLGHRAVGTTLLFDGKLDEARQHLQDFMDLYAIDRHETLLTPFGASSHAAMTAVGLAEIAVLQGDAAATKQWSSAATQLATTSGTGHDLCNVTLFVGCILPALDGRLTESASAAKALAELSLKHSLPLWGGYSKLFEGIAALASGQTEAGRALSEEGIAEMLDSAAFLRFCIIFHAEACVIAGLVQEARQSLLLSGLGISQPENWLTAEVLRLEAVIAWQDGQNDTQIADLFDRAEEVALRQGAHRFHERIAQSREQISNATTLGLHS